MSPEAPVFPPLFHGHAVSGASDPFAKACAEALLGCDSGLVAYNIAADHLHAALVLAPEVPLEAAMAGVVACGVGFQNALGALAPPEVAVHLTWAGGILVNGARCGRLRAAAATADPAQVPDWMVVGLEVPLIPSDETAPGVEPDQTCLFEEGCADVDARQLLEAWVRHSLIWINAVDEGDIATLHHHWQGIAHGVGEATAFCLGETRHEGTFVGTDEHFGMLLRDDATTTVVPLSRILEGRGAT